MDNNIVNLTPSSLSLEDIAALFINYNMIDITPWCYGLAPRTPPPPPPPPPLYKMIRNVIYDRNLSIVLQGLNDNLSYVNFIYRTKLMCTIFIKNNPRNIQFTPHRYITADICKRVVSQ